jgi:alkanesulfonate monooxygenase SsuD/methylene tetrahydromethanopterin reductase-like flavin-dependent oxidoreductase (luciferase family)
MTDPSPAAPHVDAQPQTLDEAQRRIEHLQRAVEARGRIGQAVGILMCRYMISADAAFSAMSRVSQCHNLKVGALADAVIATIDEPRKPLPRELLDALEELLRVGEGNAGRLNGSPPWWAPPSARF